MRGIIHLYTWPRLFFRDPKLQVCNLKRFSAVLC